MKKILVIIILSFLFELTYAQEIIEYNYRVGDKIELNNPSFEGIPMVAKAPEGWANCGFKGDFASDILPGYNTAFFGVNTPAYHGDTYIGMVMRGNSTWESIAQELNQPLEKDSLYRFSIFAAQSEIYTSISRSTNQTIEYITPGVLRVWAGNNACDNAQLIGQTELINHFDWFEYIFEFKADADWGVFTLEAYYDDRRSFPYAGNILLDNCSDIQKIDKLRETLKLQDLALEHVRKLARMCQENEVEQNATGQTLLSTLFLNKVFDYEDLNNGMGIQQFILSSSVSDLSVSIRCLDKLGAKHSVALIRELTRIHLKNKNREELSEVEVAYFDNAVQHFNTKMLEDDLPGLLTAYIHRNKYELLEELGECY